ncbi:TRAP transporter small permease [Celeribacter sp.]|uniref:TRAP transporter small permease n=1 Tax=Celeribacter sp. TaxID=1890673 RepID=UPI003A92A106
MSHTSPFLAFLERALDFISTLCLLIASVSLVVLIATFGWLVFGRYVLNVTPTWVEQLALLLICYIAFLGAAAGVKEDTHIGVTLFRDMLPFGSQKVVMIAIDIAMAVFGTVMLIAGITLMRFGWGTLLPMLNIPESFRTLAITSCGALILLFAGTRALVRILKFRAWSPADAYKEN